MEQNQLTNAELTAKIHELHLIIQSIGAKLHELELQVYSVGDLQTDYGS